MKTKFKGYELIRGDVVCIDDEYWFVEMPITVDSTGYMIALYPRKVFRPSAIGRFLEKLGILDKKYTTPQIPLYYNAIYELAGRTL